MSFTLYKCNLKIDSEELLSQRCVVPHINFLVSAGTNNYIACKLCRNTACMYNQFTAEWNRQLAVDFHNN